MVDLALGFCTNLNNGNITTSSYSQDASKGFSLFLMPPFANNAVDEEEKYRIEELQRNGKITDSDVAIITKLMIGIPKDFSIFVHFLHNLEVLLDILWNKDCFAAVMVCNLKEHAVENEARYREYGKAEWYFYAMVLDVVRERINTVVLRPRLQGPPCDENAQHRKSKR